MQSVIIVPELIIRANLAVRAPSNKMWLGLPWLYSQIQARFAVEGPPSVAFSFGWRKPARQDTRISRVVFVPGSVEELPPQTIGDEPRRLFTLRESCEVFIWGRPESVLSYEDEAESFAATRALYDLVRRAIHLAAYGISSVKSVEWVQTRERNAGAELRITLTLDSHVLDVPWDGYHQSTEVPAVVADTAISMNSDNLGRYTLPSESEEV